MISRLARSTISSSKNVLSAANGGRSSTGGGGSSVYQSPYIIRHLPDDINKLGFFKPYLAATNNNEKHGSSKLIYVSDINFLLSNPRMFPSFFSSEAAKNKNSEKEKKETPKGNNQESESESQEESSTEGDKRQYRPFRIIMIVHFIWRDLLPLVADEEDYHLHYGSSPHEMTFQEFKKKLLEPGLVDHIVISNNSVVKVYVINSPGNQTTVEGNSIDPPPAILKIGLYDSIMSVESFKERLETAQRVLGIDTHDYVPVTYVSKKYWYQDVDRWMGRLFALVGLWCFSRWLISRKARIYRVYKNVKNKVLEDRMEMAKPHSSKTGEVK